jgi:hypothetical protein
MHRDDTMRIQDDYDEKNSQCYSVKMDLISFSKHIGVARESSESEEGS